MKRKTIKAFTLPVCALLISGCIAPKGAIVDFRPIDSVIQGRHQHPPRPVNVEVKTPYILLAGVAYQQRYLKAINLAFQKSGLFVYDKKSSEVLKLRIKDPSYNIGNAGKNLVHEAAILSTAGLIGDNSSTTLTISFTLENGQSVLLERSFPVTALTRVGLTATKPTNVTEFSIEHLADRVVEHAFAQFIGELESTGVLNSSASERK